VAAVTPRYSPVIPPPAAGGRRATSPTPLPVLAVAPSAPATPPRRGWTLLFLPPARMPGAVRTVVLGRRHLFLPLAGAVLLLAAVSLAAGRVGGWLQEGRVAPELAQMQDRAWGRRGAPARGDGLAGGAPSGAAAARAAGPMHGGTRAAVARSRPTPRGVAPVQRAASLPLDGAHHQPVRALAAAPILRIRRPHKASTSLAASGTAIRAPRAGARDQGAREIGYGAGGAARPRRRRHHALRPLPLRARARGSGWRPGARIATVGATGLATTPHLHYESACAARRWIRCG
jgi:hypothetical protein